MDEIYKDMKILLVEDDLNFSAFLKEELTNLGLDVVPVYRGKDAFLRISKELFDLVLLDLKLPDVPDDNLLEVLNELRRLKPDTPIIVLTGEGKIKHAVEAVKQGAYDFIEKPVSLSRLMIPLRNALEMVGLRRERDKLNDQIAAQFKIIGVSAAIKDVIRKILKCAPTKSHVLIMGPTGCGKELVARAIHQAGNRAQEKYVKINCAAIPRELLESELFGHTRGSFTGAIKDQTGKFQLADGGTIFLDEIGDLDPAAQAKILRILEDGEVCPVGSEKSTTVDVRVISASNRNLQEMAAQKTFREDLYYRLSAVIIEVPPLSERSEDIPLLAREFLTRFIEANGLAAKDYSPSAIEKLTLLNWPGNVRQLKAMVEHLCIFSEGNLITAEDVNRALEQNQGARAAEDFGGLREATQDFQRRLIIAKLAKNDWRIAETADELGVNRTHFYKKLEDLGIAKQQEE